MDIAARKKILKCRIVTEERDLQIFLKVNCDKMPCNV